MQNPEEVQRVATCLREHLPASFRPELCLVCGTGFGELMDMFRCVSIISFVDIPGFPRATVPSHSGSFAAAYFAG